MKNTTAGARKKNRKAPAPGASPSSIATLSLESGTNPRGNNRTTASLVIQQSPPEETLFIARRAAESHAKSAPSTVPQINQVHNHSYSLSESLERKVC